MPQQRIPLPVQSYQDRSLPVAAQRLVNMYASQATDGAKGPVTLYNTPGLKDWATVGPGPIRGLQLRDDTLYVVSGEDLYRVASNKATTLAGTIPGAGLVQMDSNGTDVVVCNQLSAYRDDGTTFAELVSITGVPSDVTFHDGYLFFTQANSQRIFISGLNDATTYDPTEFVLANAEPDEVVGLVNLNRETWVFGTQTTQIYYNSGDADFPFTRVPSGVIQVGCLARNSIADFRGVACWLGDDRRVYISNQQQAQAISTKPIEREILTYAAPTTALGFMYLQEGHIFYVLTFTERTWVYDLTTQRWHERNTVDRTDWRAHTHESAFGLQLVGDVSDGRIYELDLDTYEGVRREVVMPILHGDGNTLFLNSLEVDFEGGVALQTGQGSDPQVMLDWTDDGGRTWSSEHWTGAGKIGEYGRRARWYRLGSTYQRHLRVAFTDPIKWAISGAYAALEAGEP